MFSNTTVHRMHVLANAIAGAEENKLIVIMASDKRAFRVFWAGVTTIQAWDDHDGLWSPQDVNIPY